jgi:hypothetical protein
MGKNMEGSGGGLEGLRKTAVSVWIVVCLEKVIVKQLHKKYPTFLSFCGS